MKAYMVEFDTENAAIARCSMKNRACRRANNYRDIYCVVPGPADDFAVVDLETAIDLEGGYFIAD
jgi:hypothetical protein